MFLKISNKENSSPSKRLDLEDKQVRRSASRSSLPGVGAQPGSQSNGKTVEDINCQVLQQELKRVRQSYEYERAERSQLSHDKTRLEGMMKVLQIERDNQYNENQRLKAEIKEQLAKITAVQSEATKQIGQFYAMKNQNSILQVEINQLKARFQKEEQQRKTLLKNNSELRIKNSQLSADLINGRNEVLLRDMEIQRLDKLIQELKTENKVIAENTQNNERTYEQQFMRLCSEIQVWKTAFEKKESEVQSKTSVLCEENKAMKKTIQELKEQYQVKQSQGLSRSLSLPTQKQSSNNEYHIRLFVKETQIEQLTQKLTQLQRQNQQLRLENALYSKKLTQGTVFSPAGYQRYTEVQNAIIKNGDLKKQAGDLQLDLQSKEKEIQCYVQKLSEARQSAQTAVIECRKLQAEMSACRIGFDNQISQLNATKTKLEREVENLKNKCQSLQAQCSQKDKIIVNYVKAARK